SAGESPVVTTQVRYEYRVTQPWAPLQQLEQNFGVGELRYPLRVHEARCLDDRRAGVHESFDELGLYLGRDGRLLVLQSVAGAYLVHGDVSGEPGVREHLGQPRGHDGSLLAGTSAVGAGFPAAVSMTNSSAPIGTC